MMNKQNIEKLYQLILNEDECLESCHWENMYIGYYSTPKDIIDELIEIFLDTDFKKFDKNSHKFISINNKEEKKAALIKFFETTIQDLKEKKYEI